MAPTLEPTYNAHVKFYIRAKEDKRQNAPPVVPELMELRRTLNLGSYTVEEFADLLEKIEERIEEWVESNPPASEA